METNVNNANINNNNNTDISDSFFPITIEKENQFPKLPKELWAIIASYLIDNRKIKLACIEDLRFLIKDLFNFRSVGKLQS